MDIAFGIVGIAFAAFCVWLTVRIVNRRERWAKWTAVVLVTLLPALYVLSVGPVRWMYARGLLPDSVLPTAQLFYWPLESLRSIKPIGDALNWYVELWDL